MNTISEGNSSLAEGYGAAGGTYYLYDSNGNLGANQNERYTDDASGNKLVKVVEGTIAETTPGLIIPATSCMKIMI